MGNGRLDSLAKVPVIFCKHCNFSAWVFCFFFVWQGDETSKFQGPVHGHIWIHTASVPWVWSYTVNVAGASDPCHACRRERDGLLMAKWSLMMVWPINSVGSPCLNLLSKKVRFGLGDFCGFLLVKGGLGLVGGDVVICYWCFKIWILLLRINIG